jgi:flagellar basal body-associated protein FliL
VYCVAAVLAVQIALGGGGRADRQGALKSLADEPFGHALVVILAAGFAAYALWRFAKAAAGAGEGKGRENGAKGVAKRLADVGRGAIYVGFLYTAIRLLTSGKEGGGSDQEAKTWSARLMAHDAGQWVVLVAGAVVIVVGAVLIVRAFAQKFEDHLDERRMNRWERDWLPRLGIVGYAARGTVATLIGAFVIQAAVTFDPQKAVGVDGALKRLAGEPYGPFLLALVAVGLLAFGAFSFVEARWRKVLDD